MALMFPRKLRKADCKSAAEEDVFHGAEEQLDDSWLCFHSASWVMRDPGRGAIDGEIDFVLAHPFKGIICLEVKGGKLACKHGQWQRWVDGRWEPAKDPFTQALDHRYALQRLIDGVPGWRGKDLLMVHGVAFPDVTAESALAPDGPREILIDARDVRALPAAIERVLAFHKGSRERRIPPGSEGVDMLRELLARDVELRVPMAQSFAEEDDELVRLTAEQAALLGRLGRVPRMCVTGCAGSGKTMIALEQARRWRRAGRDVLFVCFNRRLRAHLAEAEKATGIRFWTFHAFCLYQARKARIGLPERGDDPPQAYWEDELPEALMDAMSVLGPQFDALVIDEAQDLHTHWLTALMACLRDEAQDPVWLFLDDNQNVYRKQLTVSAEFVPFDLTWNCRNTQAIHREVAKLYKGAVEPESIGPEGRKPEVIRAEDQVGCVATLLERFCLEEGLRQEDVVVLSSHPLESSGLAQTKGKLGRFELTGDRAEKPGVLFSSIRSFKGLESPVVILCELEDLDVMTREQQLYVGLSRARNHVVSVLPME